MEHDENIFAIILKKSHCFEIGKLSSIKKFPFSLIFELPLVLGNCINYQILVIKTHALRFVVIEPDKQK